MRALKLVCDTQNSYDSEVNLKSLSRDDLLNATREVIKTETNTTIRVIKHIAEINRRQLYLECGYSSLFDMLTKHFNYCAGSAQIRINSMRLLLDFPQVESKIQSGELTLTAASQVQSFLKLEKKERKTYSQEQKLALLETCSRKSTREVERELAARNPQVLKREVIRTVSETHSRLNLSIRNDLLEKLEKLKGLLSHINSNMSYEDLLEKMAEIALEQVDPVRRAENSQRKESARPTQKPLHAHEVKPQPATKPEVSTEKRSRYIPASARHQTWIKNANQGCDYLDSKSGKRCGSKHFLQVDHRKPFSLGGTHDPTNLRILCGQHNRWTYNNCSRR